MTSAFGLHPDFRCELRHIGAAQHPVLVIDNFLAAPERIVDAAAALRFSPVGRGYYPGVRARMHPDYSRALLAYLGQTIFDTFGAGGAGLDFIECNLSLVTTPPRDLVRLQRVPHYDSSSTDHLAVLHYLCDETHGGTAFFRHKRTGVEIVDAAHSARYLAAVDEDVAAYGEPPPGYLTDASPAYEKTGSIEARFNRLVVYRGAILHSAIIPRDHALSTDPRTGRLTVNAFIRVLREA